MIIINKSCLDWPLWVCCEKEIMWTSRISNKHKSFEEMTQNHTRSIFLNCHLQLNLPPVTNPCCLTGAVVWGWHHFLNKEPSAETFTVSSLGDSWLDLPAETTVMLQKWNISTFCSVPKWSDNEAFRQSEQLSAMWPQTSNQIRSGNLISASHLNSSENNHIWSNVIEGECH